jgi:hypothetical protein
MNLIQEARVNSSILHVLKQNDSSASNLSKLKLEADGKFETYLSDITVDLNNIMTAKTIKKI